MPMKAAIEFAVTAVFHPFAVVEQGGSVEQLDLAIRNARASLSHYLEQNQSFPLDVPRTDVELDSGVNSQPISSPQPEPRRTFDKESGGF